MKMSQFYEDYLKPVIDPLLFWPVGGNRKPIGNINERPYSFDWRTPTITAGFASRMCERLRESDERIKKLITTKSITTKFMTQSESNRIFNLLPATEQIKIIERHLKEIPDLNNICMLRVHFNLPCLFTTPERPVTNQCSDVDVKLQLEYGKFHPQTIYKMVEDMGFKGIQFIDVFMNDKNSVSQFTINPKYHFNI